MFSNIIDARICEISTWTSRLNGTFRDRENFKDRKIIERYFVEKSSAF